MENSFWSWVEPEDIDRLEKAREASAMNLVHPTLGPPITCWTLRIADLFHGPELSSRIAVAVALLIQGEELLEAPATTPDVLARWSKAHAFLAAAVPGRTAAVASWFLACGAAPQARSSPGHDGEWARALVLGFGLPALLAGEEPGPWGDLARAATPLVALLASWERLWLEPSGRDIDEAALSSWVEHSLGAPARQQILLAYAGDRRSASRRDEIRAVLSGPSVMEVVRAHWSATLASARASLTGHTSTCGAEFLDALERGFSFIETFLWLRSFARVLPERRSWRWETLDMDILRAVERIERDPSWSNSVDVQRWGVGTLKADLVADWFPRGLIELELRELLPGRELRVYELLKEIPPGELRYYRHWRGIPPDADSLGLMLQLASGVPGFPPERLESWMALVLENLGEGGTPRVWFRRSSSGATHEPPELDWAGDTCTACLLSLALGLLRTAPERFNHTLMAILRTTLARFCGGGFTGTHHYRPEFTSYLFLLVADALLRGGAARVMHEQVCECVAALVRHALSTQQLDGSWGGPQCTAWNLVALALHQPEEESFTRAARYLSETQRGDGSWLPELLYYTAGKPGYMVEYRGLEVTTAICARALAVTKRLALARGWGG